MLRLLAMPTFIVLVVSPLVNRGVLFIIVILLIAMGVDLDMAYSLSELIVLFGLTMTGKTWVRLILFLLKIVLFPILVMS